MNPGLSLVRTQLDELLVKWINLLSLSEISEYNPGALFRKSLSNNIDFLNTAPQVVLKNLQYCLPIQLLLHCYKFRSLIFSVAIVLVQLHNIVETFKVQNKKVYENHLGHISLLLPRLPKVVQSI